MIPVFVVHGVDNRTPESLAERVTQMRTHTRRDDIYPVFWGHLGAGDRYLSAVLPDVEVRDAASEGMFPAGADTPIGAAGSLAIVADAAREAVTPTAGSAAGDRVAARTAEAWVTSDLRWLPLVDNADLLREVGAALGRALWEVESNDDRHAVRGEGSRRVADALLRGFDRVAGASVGVAGARLNRWIRATKGPVLARNIGDVLVYHQNLDRVRQAVRDAIAEVGARLGSGLGDRDHPVHLVGHSLGGTIALDLATDPDRPLWTASVVTFGCQWPLFHLWSPRGTLSAYDGRPIELPPTLGHWRNLWEPLDPLAFKAATVFRSHDDQSPVDIRIDRAPGEGFATHSAYWRSPELIRQLLKAWGHR